MENVSVKPRKAEGGKLRTIGNNYLLGRRRKIFKNVKLEDEGSMVNL